MFQVRLAGEDRRHLRELAAKTQRSESEVVRLLVRQASPERVDTGLPSLRLTAIEEPERELVAA